MKKLHADPSKVMPGVKLVADYSAITQQLIVGIWEAPSIDALMPLLEGMTQAGYNGEIIPVVHTHFS